MPKADGREGPAGDHPEWPFNPMTSAYVSVSGTDFWFEPLPFEFKPGAPGSVVVLLDERPGNVRSVAVEFSDDGVVVLWLPAYCRVFWCPDDGGGPEMSRLQEIDYP